MLWSRDWVIAWGQRGEPMVCCISWEPFEYWCYLCRHSRPAFPVLLLLCDIVSVCPPSSSQQCNSSAIAMSSLLKPFSVSEVPCERRGCPSPALNLQPALERLTAATALASLPAHQRSYAAKRNLAAAAVGGRKITHPGKAILAGWFLLSIPNTQTVFSHHRWSPCSAAHSPDFSLPSIKDHPCRTGSNALGSSDATTAALFTRICSSIPVSVPRK